MALRRVLVTMLLAVFAAAGPSRAQEAGDAGASSFEAWLEGVRAEALARGIGAATVDAALAGVAPVEQVLERDRAQAEFTLTLTQYLSRRLNAPTVRRARQMAAQHRALLRKVEREYEVDHRILVAVWGLESNFGRFAGVRPTIPTLATLAWDARRGPYFRGQLLDALDILDRGYIDLPALKGSWAGALGQVQFMPSSYLQYAVDFDGDGRRDIWTSLPDVFASIANYLRAHGWSQERSWGYEVRGGAGALAAAAAVPRRASGCRALRSTSEPRPYAEWRRLGLRRASGAALPAGDREVSHFERDGRHFLVTPSYEALLGYNCAHTYALSVAMLGDRVE